MKKVAGMFKGKESLDFHGGVVKLIIAFFQCRRARINQISLERGPQGEWCPGRARASA